MWKILFADIKQNKTYAQTATISLNGSYGTTLDLQMGTNNTTNEFSLMSERGLRRKP